MNFILMVANAGMCAYMVHIRCWGLATFSFTAFLFCLTKELKGDQNA